MIQKKDYSKSEEPEGSSQIPLVVPLKNVLGIGDLTKLTGFTSIRKCIKKDLKYQEFVKEIEKVLSLFNIDNEKYNHDIVLFVCQIAEDYFISKSKYKYKSGPTKLKAVIEVCKKLFNDDELLTNKIIHMVLDKVSKTSFLKRNKKKIFIFFSDILLIFLSH